MLTLLAAISGASASDFIDVWVTTAFEDDNVRAGPDLYSPAANFVMRGNQTFFEQYESRTTDDISRASLVLYRADEGYHSGWATEAAFALRLTPYLNPDETDPGTQMQDDGSYVRLIRRLNGEDHELSLTGYAVDAGRFRLGYSYDLTWGARDIFTFETGAAPGVRLQWQKGGSYAFLGGKTAVGDYLDPDTDLNRNQAYYGVLAGGGVAVGPKLKLELGLGSFQQGQILNVQDTASELYGELITAAGVSGQIAFRTTEALSFIQSADLRLQRNSPDFIKDTYISHRQLDGAGVLVQAEIDRLAHNLLSATGDEETVLESGTAGDVQLVGVVQTTAFGMDVVYKDLPYILFNVPGLTSGVAMSPDMTVTPQLYSRLWASHYLPDAHVALSAGAGLMRPATYETADGIFVQYSAYDKEQVPTGQEAAAILSSVLGAQVDVSPSTVVVGELLYTVDNNLSDYVASDDGEGGVRISAPSEERQALGFNVMMRARF